MEQLPEQLPWTQRQRKMWKGNDLSFGRGIYLGLIDILWLRLFFVIVHTGQLYKGHRTQWREDLERVSKNIRHYWKTLFGKIEYINTHTYTHTHTRQRPVKNRNRWVFSCVCVCECVCMCLYICAWLWVDKRILTFNVLSVTVSSPCFTFYFLYWTRKTETILEARTSLSWSSFPCCTA